MLLSALLPFIFVSFLVGKNTRFTKTKTKKQVQPDEIYNLGAMSHVKVSFEMSEYTAEADGVGVLRLLNAIRSAGLEKKTRLYQVNCCCLMSFRCAKPENCPRKHGAARN